MSDKGYKLFASHYILLPDGGMGKWPIITVDGGGYILQVELRDTFKERPGMEMHPGILLPAFIDLCETNPKNDQVSPNLNRHFAHGTLLLGSSYPHQNRSFPRLTSTEKIGEDSPVFLARDQVKDLSLFHRVKEYHHEFPEKELSEILFWATQWGASKTEFKTQCGQLKEGCKPGVLVLQKVDLNTMLLTPNAQVKWLSVPTID